MYRVIVSEKKYEMNGNVYDEAHIVDGWLHCYNNPDDEDGIQNERYYPPHKIKSVVGIEDQDDIIRRDDVE